MACSASHSPGHLARTLRALAQRFDGVALAIDRMPVGHEAARLGKHQEEHAIHDRERLVEQPREVVPAAFVQAAEQVLHRLDDADAQRSADSLSVPRGGADDFQDKRSPARATPKRLLAQHAPEHSERCGMLGGQLKIELQIRARICSLRVDEAQLATVGAQAPMRHRDQSPVRAASRHKLSSEMFDVAATSATRVP